MVYIPLLVLPTLSFQSLPLEDEVIQSLVAELGFDVKAGLGGLVCSLTLLKECWGSTGMSMVMKSNQCAWKI
jgi:hypothetical protein